MTTNATCICGKTMELRKEGKDPWDYWYHTDGTEIESKDHLPVLCKNCSRPLFWTGSECDIAEFIHFDEGPQMKHYDKSQKACTNAEPSIRVYKQAAVLNDEIRTWTEHHHWNPDKQAYEKFMQEGP